MSNASIRRIALSGRVLSNGQLWEKAITGRSSGILLPSGKVKWISTVGHPVLSGTGDLEQYVGSSTDITERNPAEQALQRSEAYLCGSAKAQPYRQLGLEPCERQHILFGGVLSRAGFSPG